MHVVVLCGGNGTRMEDYSMPKPLNLIYGKPSIAYCLQNLPEEVRTLHFIAAPHLAQYNFEETIISLFKTRQCHVHWLPYFTRGALESAWVGTRDISDENTSLVFLDNDVMYTFPANFFKSQPTAFLGYSEDTSTSEAYSFLTLSGDQVIDYKEKKRISNYFCCGVYGFQSLRQFRTAAAAALLQPSSSELYMSTLFQNFLKEGEPIRAIPFGTPILHVGSLKELRNAWSHIQRPSMRVCFDLDNTLVSYPSKPGDYSSVRPIERMISLARKLHEEGHTIIIHTARRMTTHSHNIGAVIRDIASTTLKTLEDFNIPYDELIFGKPIADIYIDDRAVNPYRMDIEFAGYLHSTEKVQPLNSLPPNRYNTISVEGKIVSKRGPSTFIDGEIFYYQAIQNIPHLLRYFPVYYGATYGVDRTAEIKIEHIKSIPFYTLYKTGLLTKEHIASIFEYIDILHSTPGSDIPTKEECMSNYIDKLRDRFLHQEDYPFEDAATIQEACLSALVAHTPAPTAYIHGDLWFSNILNTYSNEIKCIDMKGKLRDRLTTGGDKYYDYGKLLQSFLGYDAILYGDSILETYRTDMLNLYKAELAKRNISYEKVVPITFSLVIGTLHSLRDSARRNAVWKWIRTLFIEKNSL